MLNGTRTGKDATEAFEDVGHSDEARDILKTLLIGTFDGGNVSPRFLIYFLLGIHISHTYMPHFFIPVG